MHLLTIPEGISEPIPVQGGKPLEGGKSYICTNAFTGALLLTPWRVMIGEEMWGLRMLLDVEPYQGDGFDPILDWNNQHIWFMRGGGWGDLLMLTPLIRALKLRWPRIRIHIATGENYRGLFDGLDVIEESIPIEETKVGGAPLIAFEDWIEGHPGATTTHMAQHFANAMGIDLSGDYRPDYIPKDEETKWAEEKFPKSNRKRFGVQYMASALYRSYPLTEDVIQLLLSRGHDVFLFGAVGQLAMAKETTDGLTNLTDPSLECTFRRSAAVAKTCDCIISPDSAMVHLASALEVPYVGLYGPMPANLRGSGKEGKGLQGVAECSPCFFHADRADQFPAGMPCSKAGMCVALAQISPKQIVDTAERLASPIIQLSDRRLM